MRSPSQYSIIRYIDLQVMQTRLLLQSSSAAQALIVKEHLSSLLLGHCLYCLSLGKLEDIATTSHHHQDHLPRKL